MAFLLLFAESKEYEQNKRDILTQLKPLLTPRPTPPPSVSQQAVNKQDLILQFTKKLYKDLGNNLGNVTRTTDKFQGEYDELDTMTDGRLGPALTSLLEIRMLDLQASIRHARRMHQVLNGFMGKNTEDASI
jgi:hypothetical protein